jgi:hypothetical protein
MYSSALMHYNDKEYVVTYSGPVIQDTTFKELLEIVVNTQYLMPEMDDDLTINYIKNRMEIVTDGSVGIIENIF